MLARTSSPPCMVLLAEPSPLFHLPLEQQVSGTAVGFCAGFCWYVPKEWWFSLTETLCQVHGLNPIQNQMVWHSLLPFSSHSKQGSFTPAILFPAPYPWTMPSPGDCSASSLGQSSASSHGLLCYIHGCGHCDLSYSEGCSCGLCYAMHRDVAECTFLL